MAALSVSSLDVPERAATLPIRETGDARPEAWLQEMTDSQLEREVDTALKQGAFSRARAAIGAFDDVRLRDRERLRLVKKVESAGDFDLAQRIVGELEDAQLREIAQRDLTMERIKQQSVR